MPPPAFLQAAPQTTDPDTGPPAGGRRTAPGTRSGPVGSGPAGERAGLGIPNPSPRSAVLPGPRAAPRSFCQSSAFTAQLLPSVWSQIDPGPLRGPSAVPAGTPGVRQHCPSALLGPLGRHSAPRSHSAGPSILRNAHILPRPSPPPLGFPHHHSAHSVNPRQRTRPHSALSANSRFFPTFWALGLDPGIYGPHYLETAGSGCIWCASGSPSIVSGVRVWGAGREG